VIGKSADRIPEILKQSLQSLLSFDWIDKDRKLHARDWARAYGHARRANKPAPGENEKPSRSSETSQTGSAPSLSAASPSPSSVTSVVAAGKGIQPDTTETIKVDGKACTVRKLGNHIAGKAVYARSGQGVILDRNPATNEVVATVPRSGKAEVDAAVEAARRAQPAWAATPLAERCRILAKAADLIEGRLMDLARLESLDTGKPIGLSSTLDIPRAVSNFRFFAKFAAEEETERHAMEAHDNHTVRAPVGVVGLITPWNLPLYLLSWKTAPALAMGNAVVAKPSELTPQTADALAWILKEAGLPDGVFNVVHGHGGEAGQALVEHPEVRAISFTGGTLSGRKVAAAAAPHLKKVSLELGGKNATIVFADCDMEATVDGVVRSAFLNTGQICLCGSRILVERSIEAEFTARLVARAILMRSGDPLDPATQVGPLVSQEHRAKVEGYLDLARNERGAILCGGKRPDLPTPWSAGAYLEPTVINGLPQSSRCVQEEIFGPVATVQPFDTEAEAVALANGVRYGLAASVWSKDTAKATRVAEALETGMVWVNCWLVRDLRVPFGGMKESGVGREGGTHSLDFFSELRNICVRRPA
jgi:aminomuconate-semialdehyde/2-hydroxymuconate-6-semialdehyde dehydrogenase